ncbi:MAG: prenyltransferase/squalene oxidase repeat-containing protein [Isosphaeraceae bacterium]
MRHDQDRRRFLVESAGLAGAFAWFGLDGVFAAEVEKTASAMVDGAVAFLRGRQAASGVWSADRNEPGITALVVTALLRSKRVAPGEPVVMKGLAYLQTFVGDKGGLSEAPHSVYSTSVALMAFKEANRDGRFDALIRGSQAYLKGVQIDESEGRTQADASYGGLGYGGGGGNSRPDLSNTAFFVEALRDSGLPADDPALKKALVFVSRCQNLKSEFNDQPWAGKVNDGGFVYNPSASGGGGQGKAKGNGKGADVPLRSFAGMTYSGLKSMIHAGLTHDDPRVKAALGYIQQHYTLDENPGQGTRGLYYYYMTFARALALLGRKELVDSEGIPHDWRADLLAALRTRQAANGSWVNPSDSFMEGDPNIVTSYALLALAAAGYCG